MEGLAWEVMPSQEPDAELLRCVIGDAGHDHPVAATDPSRERVRGVDSKYKASRRAALQLSTGMETSEVVFVRTRSFIGSCHVGLTNPWRIKPNFQFVRSPMEMPMCQETDATTEQPERSCLQSWVSLEQILSPWHPETAVALNKTLTAALGRSLIRGIQLSHAQTSDITVKSSL